MVSKLALVCRASILEGHERHGMVLGHGADQGLHGVAVAVMPEPGKRAAFELPAIACAQVRSREPERELVGVVEFEDEGVGQRLADAGRVDIAAIWRTPRASNRIPIGIELLGARHLHGSDPLAYKRRGAVSPRDRAAAAEPSQNATVDAPLKE